MKLAALMRKSPVIKLHGISDCAVLVELKVKPHRQNYQAAVLVDRNTTCRC